jgi:RHS repeat-associated protein
VLERASSADFAVLEVASGYSYALERSQTASIPVSLSNVTRGATAYRNGNSANAVRVRIGVNRTLGVSKLREAKVMYFDYGQKSWLEAPVRNVDHAAFMIEAEVPGGTDYFAALIKTPEMPEASAFMPTAISDLEPKSPAEGITLIQPPTANQQGDANISYPLTIPQGRQGMTPQLALNYSSSGAESWCGYGWSIPVQSISVDTRWGVPTFDMELESEVYTLDGQSLHGQNGDKANRPKVTGNNYDPVFRVSGPQNFFTRTQGSYRTIVRYGNSPENYFWVVTDANQTKYYYGTKDGQTADVQSELKAGANITQWFLSRIVDKWGNAIDYSYSKYSQYPAGLFENGTAMWLTKLTYTGFANQSGYTPGKYSVEFVTSQGRVDGRISMNKGLKLVDDRKLTDIVIKYDNQEVKRYKLDLQAGYFNKTKLAGVSEWHKSGAGSAKFYEHTFDYYGSNDLTYTEKTIAIDHRNSDAGNIPSEMDGWLGRAVRGTIPPSVLSSTASVGWKGGRRFGVGYDPTYALTPVALKYDNDNTIGFQYSRGDNLSITKHQMMDVNGDGIPDILMEFATGTKAYRPGVLFSDDSLSFGEFSPISYRKSFVSHSSSNQLTLDWTGKVDFRGISLANTHAAPLRSFTDYNADGVLDILEQGFSNVKVKFGRMATDGTLYFENSSENTLNPVLKGQPVASTPTDNNNDPIEIIRYWKAPKSGMVNISGSASCASGAQGTAKVAVQKNGGFEVPFTDVTPAISPSINKSNINVSKDDILMFRTHYSIDGYDDFIKWNPTVTYTIGASITDGAGNEYFNSTYADAFLVTSPSTVLVNADDEIEIELGAPTNYTATADLHFVIRQTELDELTGDVIDQKRYVSIMAEGSSTLPTSFYDENGASAPFIGQKGGLSFVASNSQILLSFEVLSSSNIRWQELKWRPILKVTNPSCPDLEVSQYPVVEKVVYNKLLDNEGSQIYSGTNQSVESFADITANQTDLNSLLQDFSFGDKLIAYMTTKSGNKTLSEKAIVITKKSSGHTIEFQTVDDELRPGVLLNSTSYNGNSTVSFLGSTLINQGSNTVHFEFSTKGDAALELAEYIHSHLNGITIKDMSNSVQASYSGTNLKRNIYYQSAEDEQYEPYLHWGQFAWRAHDGQEFDAISPSDLHMVISGASNTNMDSFTANQSSLETLGHQLDIESNRYFQLSPTRGEYATALRAYHKTRLLNSPERDRWSLANSYIAAYLDGFVSPGILGESEHMPDNMSYTSIFSAYGSMNESVSRSLSYQEGVGKWGGSANIQDGLLLFSHSPRMFLDLNGDNYPDVVRAPYAQNVKVQLTNLAGGHTSETTLNGIGNLSKSRNYSGGVTYNGEWSNDKPKFTLESFGGDLGYSHDDFGMVDFNGDGLQDRMNYVFGGTAKLELNNGHGFESLITTPMANAPGNGLLEKNLNIDFQSSITVGPFALGLESDVLNLKYKLNLKKSSIKAGLGINLNGQSPERIIVDLNGDGLTDIIEIDAIANYSSYSVFLNTGTTYIKLTSHQLGTTINSFRPIGSSNTLGADATRKYTFGVIVYGFQAVKSTEVSANYGYTRLSSSFRDMNGDGAVDVSYMMGNGDLKVYYSDLGLCNKLKSVHNPLGGHFDIDYDFIAGQKGITDKPVVKTDKAEDIVVWHMSSGRYVLGKVTIHDGLDMTLNGEDLDGDDALSYTFKYDGGVFNPREREFQGFNRVETVHQNQTLTGSSNQRFISEVVEYVGLEEISLEAFIKHSAVAGLVKVKSTYFNENFIDLDSTTKTLLNIERYFYEHYGVNQQRDQPATNYQIDFGAVQQDWDLSTETQSIFNAVTSIESISFPDKDERNLTHAQKVDLQYDVYGNVILYKDYGPIVPQPLVPTLVEHKTITRVLTNIQSNDCSGDPNVTMIANHPNYPDHDLYIVECADPSFENDTIIIPKSPNTACIGEGYHDRCVDGGQITSHHRKVTTQVVDIYEDRLPSITYNGARIALLDYFPPSSASGQTGVLKRQSVYVNSTVPSNLKRESTVTSLHASRAPSEISVTLNSTEKATTNLEYDTYGNVTKITGAQNGNSQRAFSQFTYDATNHQFIEGVVNHFGENTCNKYDYRTGNVLRTTEVNGHAIQYVYDQFNRLSEIWAPRELKDLSRGPTIRYNYTVGNGSVAVTYHNTSNLLDSIRYIGDGCALNTSIPIAQPMTSFVRTATFVDGLGQAVQVKTDRSQESGTLNVPAVHVSGTAEKDQFGIPVKARADFIDPSNTPFTSLSINAGHVVSQTTLFDYMYRPLNTEQWVDINVGSGGNTTTNFQYTWDPSNNQFFTGQTISGASNSSGISGVDMLSREYVDTYGRKVLAMQADPNDLPGASNTAFAYSPLGELLTVTDPLGAVTSYTYDMAGRLLSEDHPDRGLTETAYDKASNVVGITNEATRALNGAITLDYDFNRLVNKTIAGSTGNDLYDIRYEYGNATSGSGKNGIGRVIKITQGEDATGNVFKTDYLKYDELGNVSVETKDFIVPNVGNRSYTTTKLYDSFGRIRRAVYPDGDQVSYGYTGFGELYSIASSLTGFPTQNIISSVRYDGYGNIKTLAYGNGTQTDYTYSANTKSLFGSEVLGKVAGGTTNVSLMDRAYTYNGNGMIANMTRGIHTSLVSMGENVQTTAFEYDHLGRLGMATTSFAGTAGNQYSVSTSYNKAGGILEKVSTTNASAKVYSATAQEMNYDLIYRYSNSKPHQLEDVISSSGAPYAKSFVYNASGSISEITDMTGPDHSSFYWGQEQWLCGVQNSQGIHHYVYDHAGERVMKSSITQTTVQLNDQTINTVTTLEPFTLYVNPYYVITAFSNADRKSKHYYMGTQRVATDLGVEYGAGPTPQESMASSPNTTAKTGTHSGDATYLELTQSPAYTADLQRVLDQLSEGLSVAEVTMTSTPIEQFYPDLAQETAAETTESEPPLYSGSRILFWYHPDYVSNVDLVTDMTGASYELFLYNAWGENLHHWRSGSSNTWSSPYRFNSKELDPETGMHYYGARYHQPKLSVWMSVDPYSAKTLESYQYTGNNPITLLDADGNWPYTIFINSFHPWSSFGGNGNPEQNFGGDNRPFGNNPETASSRVHHKVNVNNADGYMFYSNDFTRSDKSTHPSKGVKKSIPYGWAFLDYGSESIVRVTTGYSASNPHIWYAPSIDVSAVVMITENQDNTIRLQAKVFGDNFPNTELSVGDNSEQVLLVGTDVRASRNDDMPTILFGGASTQIMDIDLMIRIDNLGNFTHVYYDGNWISVKSYNAIQREKDPNAYD